MAETIHVKLPDGSVKDVPRGTSALDIAKGISPRLADAALAAQIRPLASNGNENVSGGNGHKHPEGVAVDAKNGAQLIDLARPLEQDVELRLLTDRDPEALEVYRHSSAHLMAAAVLELFPETKLGHGPATESGFFYDFYREKPFSSEDLEAIEKKMQELVKQDLPYAREFLPRQEGLERFKSEGDFMKCHFIEQFTSPDEKISIYKTGKFTDFCRGPHIPSTGRIKAFKVLSIAGAYWLGDEKNPQLQRIYGTSFFSKKDLDEYLKNLEEAKKRDHRVLGKQLDLFSIQELAGPGLIFWHPKGGIMRKEMEDWMREEYLKRGYSLVHTPHVARVDLWKTSGHEGYYAQNMFTPMELDDADYRMKPMNCPFHILIYRDSLKSYRDLPVRLGEMGTVYRYERSGVMHGLLRVRGFTHVRGSLFAGGIHCCFGYVLSATLHLAGDDEQSLQLLRDVRLLKIGMNLLDHIAVTQMACCRRAVTGLAEVAIVERRNVGRDQFAFARQEAVGLVQQSVGQLAQRLGCLGTKCERGTDSRQFNRQWDMRHFQAPCSACSGWPCCGRYSRLMVTYPSLAVFRPRCR